MARSFPHGLVGLGLEIASVDGFEARLLHAEIFEAALHGDDFNGRLRTHVAVGVQPQLTDAGILDTANARDERKTFGKTGALSLDIDDIAAADPGPTGNDYCTCGAGR